MRKIGINFRTVDGISDEEYVKTISQLGFNVTFTKMYDAVKHTELAELFIKYGIEQETIHAPFHNLNEIWLDNEDGKSVADTFMKCVDNCVISHVPVMVVHLSSGDTPPPVTDIGRRRFTEIVEYAAKKNICIAFENQRKLSNLAWAFETFGPDTNVGFCWDCGHESCFTPGVEYMPLFGNRLICTHVHDNTGIYNDDSHLLPFDGKIDYKRFAELIRKFNYTGSIMLEVKSNASNRYDNISAFEYMERAANAANKLVQLID